MTMKQLRSALLSAVLAGSLMTSLAAAAGLSHTVVRGDTLWKIASSYQVGTSELIQANPQLSNPDRIYPGQVLSIPQLDDAVARYEAEVLRLVNDIRRQNELSALQSDWELARVARYKSQDMADNRYFSHTSPTYGSPFQMFSPFL